MKLVSITHTAASVYWGAGNLLLVLTRKKKEKATTNIWDKNKHRIETLLYTEKPKLLTSSSKLPPPSPFLIAKENNPSVHSGTALVEV